MSRSNRTRKRKQRRRTPPMSFKLIDILLAPSLAAVVAGLAKAATAGVLG